MSAWWKGVWHSDVHNRSGEMAFKLALKDGKYSGEGSDNHFGAFTWTGTLGGSDVVLFKHYPNHNVEYRGRFVGNTFSGHWANDTEAGSFWIDREAESDKYQGYWVSRGRKGEQVKMTFELETIGSKLHGRGVDERYGAFTWLGTKDEHGNVFLTKYYPYRVVQYQGKLAGSEIAGSFSNDQGDKGSFKFTKDEAEHWVAHWSVGSATGAIKSDMEFAITLANGMVCGEGEDERFGKFTWTGTYNADGQIKMFKHYPQRTVDYIGRLYGDLFVGSWANEKDAGTFDIQRTDRGQWEGLWISGNRQAKQTHMAFDLEFVGSKVFGKGVDDRYGDFKLAGEGDGKGGLYLVKTYPSRTIEYTGKIEGDKIVGTFVGDFKGTSRLGHFLIVRQDLVYYTGEWTSNSTKEKHTMDFHVSEAGGNFNGQGFDEHFGPFKYEGTVDGSGNAKLIKHYPERTATYIGKLAGNLMTGTANTEFQFADFWVEKHGEKWLGYWVLRSKEQAVSAKMEFTIKIADGKITGAGLDERFGKYTWVGTVDLQGNVVMTKTYPHRTVEYSGKKEGSKIVGTWKNDYDAGAFTMAADGRSHYKGHWETGVEHSVGVSVKYTVQVHPDGKAEGKGFDDRYAQFTLTGTVQGEKREFVKHYPKRTVDYKGKLGEHLMTGTWCNDNESGTFWLQRNETGTWKGFWVSLGLKGQKTLMTFDLHIKDGKAAGKGTDERFGVFTIEGTVDALGNILLVKEYPAREVHYSGIRKGDRAEGTWKNEADSGTYVTVLDA
jgi:hypothetical protein